MILYNEGQSIGLSEFGMHIPVRQSKAARTFRELCEHPILGPLKEVWHRRPEPGGIDRPDLLRVHSQSYVGRLYSQDVRQEILKTYELINEDGTYRRFSPDDAERRLEEVFDQALQKTSGTWQCCRAALAAGFCFYFGGGMHHASRGQGKGFCLINDVVIALRKLQAASEMRRAWIIDVDAHKGDGTASLTLGDDSITTLSVHMAAGWPLDEPEYDAQGRFNPSHLPSDIDVPVPEDGEGSYLDLLEGGLAGLDRCARPDLAVVLSGADPFEADELESAGALRLSLETLFQRDRRIFTFLEERGIPKAYVMSGGYGEETWRVYTQFLIWALTRLYA